jgi:PPK2 family polyphosphate:nucleotide phosphotransferase
MANKRDNLVTQLRVVPTGRISLNSISAAKTFAWAKEAARERTERNLQKLEELQYHLYADKSKALLIVLQGIDAAGKDGVIRKVFTAFNPQGTHVTSFKVPAGREVAHDYLWRVHAACPPRGSIGIFNRSHYEDLIVPMLNDELKGARLEARIEQMNAFEQLLVSEGTTVIKFLLHISREEQWERLMARLDDPTRNWKFRMGDLAERQRWDKYITTFSKVVKSTSTDSAPWYVIPADSKWFRDLAVSEVVCQTLRGMKLQWPSPSDDVRQARRELKRLR